MNFSPIHSKPSDEDRMDDHQKRQAVVHQSHRTPPQSTVFTFAGISTDDENDDDDRVSISDVSHISTVPLRDTEPSHHRRTPKPQATVKNQQFTTPVFYTIDSNAVSQSFVLPPLTPPEPPPVSLASSSMHSLSKVEHPNKDNVSVTTATTANNSSDPENQSGSSPQSRNSDGGTPTPKMSNQQFLNQPTQSTTGSTSTTSSTHNSSRHHRLDDDVSSWFRQSHCQLKQYYQSRYFIQCLIHFYIHRKQYLLVFLHWMILFLFAFHFTVDMHRQIAQHTTSDVDELDLFVGALSAEQMFVICHYGIMHALLLQMALLPVVHLQYTVSILLPNSLLWSCSWQLPLHQIRSYMTGTLFLLIPAVMLQFLIAAVVLGYDDVVDETLDSGFSSASILAGYGIVVSTLFLVIGWCTRRKYPYTPGFRYFQHGVYAALVTATVVHVVTLRKDNNDPQGSVYLLWLAIPTASSTLQFYIASSGENQGQNNWAAKLRDILEEDRNCNKSSCRTMDVEIMGPIGAPLPILTNCSHVVAIGVGSGVLPLVTALKQHVNRLSRKNPDDCLQQMKEYSDLYNESAMNETTPEISMAMRILRFCLAKKSSYLKLEDDLKESLSTVEDLDESISPSKAESGTRVSQMQHVPLTAPRLVYYTAILCLLFVIGVTLLGLIIVWNNISQYHVDGIEVYLALAVVAYQTYFGVIALFIEDATKFTAILDVVVTLCAPLVDWCLLYEHQQMNRLSLNQLVLSCFLVGYMTIRVWTMIINNGTQSSGLTNELLCPTEKLHLVWVTESTSLSSGILLDLNQVWEAIVNAWGEVNATRICEISVYITDANDQACVQEDVRDTLLYRSGFIHFRTPDFEAILQSHSADVVATHRYSRTSVTYVGPPDAAQNVHQWKVRNDALLASFGYTNRHHTSVVVRTNSHLHNDLKSASLATTGVPEGSMTPDEQTHDHCSDGLENDSDDDWDGRTQFSC